MFAIASDGVPLAPIGGDRPGRADDTLFMS